MIVSPSAIFRDTVQEWNLTASESKTESVHIHIDYPSSEESWQHSKSFGFLLCSKADLIHHCSNLGHCCISLTMGYVDKTATPRTKEEVIDLPHHHCSDYAAQLWQLGSQNHSQRSSWTNVTDAIFDTFLAYAGKAPSATISSTRVACNPQL